ncbi:MAG: NAD(P)-binding domain-containing protein [Eggerthella lenta]
MELSFVYSGNETVGAMVVSRLEAAGCTRTDDVAHAEAIITYCTSQTALEDAYFDEQGLVQAAGKGALLIDLSASTHSFARELNAVAVVSDLMSVEAPLVVDVAPPTRSATATTWCASSGATRRPWRRRVPCWKRSPARCRKRAGRALRSSRAPRTRCRRRRR